MAALTIRKLPDHVHRALRLRAAASGRSVEAEVRAILESVVAPPERVKLGSMLAEIGQAVQLSDAEVDLLNERDRGAPEPVDFE